MRRVDDSIWQHHIFLYLMPYSDYMNILLVNKSMNKLLRRSDCFKFIRLYCVRHTQIVPLRYFPSIHYLKSYITSRTSSPTLQLLDFIQQIKYRAQLTTDNMWGMPELLARCLIRLKMFQFTSHDMKLMMKEYHWLTKDLHSLQQLCGNDHFDKQETIQLFSQCKDILPSVLKYNQNYEQLLIRRIENTNDQRTMEQIVQMCPYFALPLLQKQKIRMSRSQWIETLRERTVQHSDIPSEIRSDPKIALLLVFALNPPLLSSELSSNRDFILQIVPRVGLFPCDFLDDKEVVLAGVKRNGLHLSLVSKRLSNDPDVVKVALSSNASSIMYASSAMHNNKDVMLTAVKKVAHTLLYASDGLKNQDEEFMRQAIEHSLGALNYTRNPTFTKDKYLLIEALCKKAIPLSHLTREMRLDPDVVMYGLRVATDEYLDTELHQDEDLFLEYVKMNARQTEPEHKILTKAPMEMKANRDIVGKIIEDFGDQLTEASDELRKDKSMVLRAIETCNYDVIPDLTEPFLNDRDYVLQLVAKNASILQFLDDSLLNDREVIRTALEQDANVLRTYILNISLDVWSDAELVKEAIWNDIEVTQIQHLLISDKELALFAIEQNYAEYGSIAVITEDRELYMAMICACGKSLREDWYCEKFLSDKQFVLEALDRNIDCLRLASEELRGDEQVAFKSVTKCGLTLSILPERFRSDVRFVLQAVKQDGRALRYASDSVREDVTVVTQAVSKHGKALRYVPDAILSQHREIILLGVSQSGVAIQWIKPSNFDKEILFTAVKSDGLALQFIKEKYRDKQLVMTAVQENATALQYVPLDSEKYIDYSKELVLTAVRQDSRALAYARQYINDKEVILASLQSGVQELKRVKRRYLFDRTFVLDLVKCNGLALKELPYCMLKDREVVMSAVQQNGMALKYACLQFRRDPEIVNAAFGQNKKALKYVSLQVLPDTPWYTSMLFGGLDQVNPLLEI